MSRRAVLIALAGAVALLLGGAAAFGVAAQWALGPVAKTAPDTIVRIAPGTGLSKLANELEARGLVRSARAFVWLARYRGLAGQLKVGEFRLSAELAPEQILQHIVEGRVVTYPVVIPEGLTAVQIAQRLHDARLVDGEAFLALANDSATAAALGVEGDTLEGYLFPETYHLPNGLTPSEVAGVLVGQFLRVWREVEPRAREQGLSMREVVILASIVEKETGAADERPLIASVFRNRLERGMRLETDPTVIYGIPDFDGNLRRRDLEDTANPYNTYVISGLPPGPIANPGADALRAVVDPAESDYLFFVSRNDGTHFFSKTYGEHVLAVNKYQRRRRIR